ncbi:AAA family ATPase [Curtobacterium citreum]|uniref:AAA family ATPase n=1 Tax=Curtobacterium citreum TaxID=2036 RepID=UPI00254305FB|nr:AAA family ATPase [Curtobacterium citreum]WIJ44838.1 AAA family ATPase [Curtobacterium citreum]
MPPTTPTTNGPAKSPRDLLSEWANQSDEWVRYIVRQVLTGGSALTDDEAQAAYALFRQEKAFDQRTLPDEGPLATIFTEDDSIEPLVIDSLSDVHGVNALVYGGAIEPHEGLTILFGENGTGKTGYSRIFKALAASRTADIILGDIGDAAAEKQSATISYRLGTQPYTQRWSGQHGVAPFTRMSIFDSPSVSFHVDDSLEYVYTPASLALFNHVTAAIRAVQQSIETAKAELTTTSDILLQRFSRSASVYPLIQTLGAATDLETLRSRSDVAPDVEERLAKLARAVAALEADTLTAEVKVQQRTERVLKQAVELSELLERFDSALYSSAMTALKRNEADYELFRSSLFEAADLPAEPDETWTAFLTAGESYKQHLVEQGVHDADRCLYCRQPLEEAARVLVTKYSDLLEDAISKEILKNRDALEQQRKPVQASEVTDITSYLSDHQDASDNPPFIQTLNELLGERRSLLAFFDETASLPSVPKIKTTSSTFEDALEQASEHLERLRKQLATREETLATKQKELIELKAAAELGKSWGEIEQRVLQAKEADRLQLLAKPISGLLRTVTTLSKTASDELVNRSFESLFEEERLALRAPELKLEFVGRDGRAKRQKVMSGKHKPSKVLSEGEQKVLAMADFLAEARLAGITAPVIFDDPVSSLDHRRVREVAERIAKLASSIQVIVFTHDILFATTLLHLMEKSGRCNYFQITDINGKGQVSKASGPRWDTTKSIKKRIDQAISDAEGSTGETRAAFVITGYNLIRSWCEVFIENELLQGVTRRYQPNVAMGALERIKVGMLEELFETVNRVFEDACRYIDGHSQPLATLGVTPTIDSLKADWKILTDAAASHRAAA